MKSALLEDEADDRKTGDFFPQEATAITRIAELRRQGMWSPMTLPLCVEPPRNKTHWDYLLEEVR